MNWEELDFCGRCLVILDARTSVMDMETKEKAPNPAGSVVRLRRWLEDHIYGSGHAISVDERPYAFRSVATWHGDPVCQGHLIECRERELRGGR